MKNQILRARAENLHVMYSIGSENGFLGGKKLLFDGKLVFVFTIGAQIKIALEQLVYAVENILGYDQVLDVVPPITFKRIPASVVRIPIEDSKTFVSEETTVL